MPNKGKPKDDFLAWQEIIMSDNSHASELVNQLKKENSVLTAYIERPIQLKPCAVPTDPQYIQQWHLNSISNPNADIRAEQAWNINSGRNDVIIAVCDGGVDYTHTDLDPGNRSRIIAGYDSGDDDNDPMDDLPTGTEGSYSGHGTHIAGIIGAIANNNQNVSGIMWNCQIMPVKMVGSGSIKFPFVGTIYDFSTTAFPSDVADAIDYAVNNGARVINLSYGFSGMGFPIDEVILRMPLLYNTIYNAYNQNVVIVAAMGNEHETGNPVEYPAGFSHEVIAVGNTNIFLQRTSSSNTGSQISVSAPGTNILSTQRGGGTVLKSGTSMAAPVVSGVAGLIISQGLDRNFNLTNDDVRHIIEKTADDITQYGIGYDTETGFGKVNAFQALSLLNVPYVLYHWVSYGGATTMTNIDKWIYTGGGRWGLTSGLYLNVDKYVVTKHVTFDVPFCSIPTVWLRERESFSLDQSNPNGGYPNAQITNITQTGFDVLYSTYFVRYNSNGQTINKWVPSTVASSKIAFTAVGIPNLATFAGPMSGPAVICSSAPFKVNAVPTGCTVSWTCSPNLTFDNQLGDQKTFYANGTGSGSVTAIINSTTCGSFTLPTKTVWVGPPTAPLDIFGIQNGWEFWSETNYDFTVNSAYVQNASQYNWVVRGGSIVAGQGTPTITYKTAKVAPGAQKTFDVSVKVGNTCGWGPYLMRSGYVNPPPGSSMFIVYPNPATTEVTVSVEADVSAKMATGSATENVEIKALDFYDMYGNRLKAEIYGKGQQSARVNVSGFQKGTYWVIVNKGGAQEEKHTLVVE
jgi:subtilisin family serine protease